MSLPISSASSTPLPPVALPQAAEKKKTKSEQLNQIRELIPLIDNNTLSELEASRQCNIVIRDLRRKIRTIKDENAKNSRQKITPEIHKKVAELLPRITRKKLTHEAAAKRCGISRESVRRIIKSIEEGKDPSIQKPSQKITPAIRDKVTALLPEIERGELSQEDVAEQCGISDDSVRKIIKSIEAGKDPSLRKPSQKITPAIRDKVTALLPEIKRGKLSQEDVAEQCGISDDSVRKIIKSIEEGKDPSLRKALQKITPAIRDKVTALLPEIKLGKLTHEAAAKQCGISAPSVRKIIQAINEGRDPSVRKPHEATTPEIRDNVVALLPEINGGKLTKRDVAARCGISIDSVKRIIQSIDTNKQPQNREVTAQLMPAAPLDSEGTTAQFADISATPRFIAMHNLQDQLAADSFFSPTERTTESLTEPLPDPEQSLETGFEKNLESLSEPSLRLPAGQFLLPESDEIAQDAIPEAEQVGEATQKLPDSPRFQALFSDLFNDEGALV